MGTSTNALLWYGVTFDGSPDDGDEIPGVINSITYGDEDDEDELYGDGREWMAEHGITGIEFVQHCSADYPMYGIAVAGSVLTARRGYPEQPTDFEPPDGTGVIRAIIELGLDPDDYPLGWCLASMWSY